MNIAKTLTRGLALFLLLFPASVAFAQSTTAPTPFELELGYRWLEISGNEDMYRTQIDEQDGFLLRSLSLTTVDFAGQPTFVDHFRIDAAELGAGPGGTLRLETGKSNLYNLRLNYHRADAFSALPAFANPLLGQGIIPGQHTFDRERQMLDLDLELLPGRHLTPFIGYSWNRYEGPGTTTYTLGADDFLLRSDLQETDKEYRVGLTFNYDKVYGVVTQGWRDFNGDESLTLAPGAGSGNNPGSILGVPISASDLTRETSTDVNTPFTSFFVTGQPTTRLKLIGNYTRLSADTDGSSDEAASGSFVSFALGRFFQGLTEEIASDARNRTWRGGARAELELVKNIDLVAGYQKEHRELEGRGLINTLFLQSVTFGGVDRRDVEAILQTDNSLDREEEVLRAGVSGRSLGPFGFWVGYSQTKQDVTLDESLEEIVVPGSQEGTYNRTIDTIDVSGSFNKAGLTLVGSWKMDDADDPILRTDYLNRDRYRLRAAYHTPGNLIRVGLTGEKTNQDNNRPGIDYDAEIKQYSADFEVQPIEKVLLRGSYSKFDTDSTILIRLPQTFDLDTSVYSEDGRGIEGGVTLLFNPVTLEADLGQFENKGSNPFDLDRFRVRLTYDLKAHAGVAFEWNRDKYDEASSSIADFEADRYGLYLRWRP